MADAGKPQLLGPDGRPIKSDAASKAALSQPIARASLTGVRQVWSAMTVVSGLTPARLAQIMRSAAEGDHHDYVVLAEEMEERDWHYAAALGQRKLAVLGLPRDVHAASDDAADVAIADACREHIVEDEAFEDLLAGALDAIGKGWSAVEIAWETSEKLWRPSTYEWRDPRWFRWDRETGRELRLLDESDLYHGLELPAYRFAVHKPQLKMGLPVRGGLARLAAWAFLFKFYSVKDWAAFCETFGQPLRLGKYDAAATPADIEVLYQAVAMIGTDCAAVIPQAMQIEFVDAMKGAAANGAELYKAFATWLDLQVSKAVLGQTGTSDMQKGGGLAQAKVLNEVRGDLRDSDALQLARTVRRDVFAPFVRFNFGPTARVPGLVLEAEEAEDLAAFSAALAPLIDRGLRVRASEVRERFALAKPGGDDEVLGPEQPTRNDSKAGLELPAGGVPKSVTAANRAYPSLDAPDAVDALVDPLDEGWTEVMDPLVEPIAALAARARSYEEFIAALDDVAAGMDVSPLARSLALAMFKARGLGDATDRPL